MTPKPENGALAAVGDRSAPYHLCRQESAVQAAMTSREHVLAALGRDPVCARQFVLRHQHRLLFGTDRFGREEEPTMVDLLEAMALPHEARHAVCPGKAERPLAMPARASAPRP
jgi:hypothetical protein